MTNFVFWGVLKEIVGLGRRCRNGHSLLRLRLGVEVSASTAIYLSLICTTGFRV